MGQVGTSGHRKGNCYSEMKMDWAHQVKYHLAGTEVEPTRRRTGEGHATHGEGMWKT